MERKKNKNYLQDLFLYKRGRTDVHPSEPKKKKKKKFSDDELMSTLNMDYIHYNPNNPPFEYDFALEYDMKEQDEQFLDEWNKKRKIHNKTPISDIWFERLMSWIQRSLLYSYMRLDFVSSSTQQESLIPRIVEKANQYQQTIDSNKHLDVQEEEVEELKQFWMKNNAMELGQLEQYQNLQKSKQYLEELQKFKQYLEMTRMYLDTFRKKERIKQNMNRALLEGKQHKEKVEASDANSSVEPPPPTDISNDDELEEASSPKALSEETKKKKRGRKRKKT